MFSHRRLCQRIVCVAAVTSLALAACSSASQPGSHAAAGTGTGGEGTGTGGVTATSTTSSTASSSASGGTGGGSPSCPVKPIETQDPSTQLGNNTGAPFVSTSCTAITASPTVLYQVVAATTGTLDVTLSSGFIDLSVYVRTDCNEDQTQIGCTDVLGMGTLSVPVTAGETVYVFVNGRFPCQSGPYTLTLKSHP
jgi:hypothetical protein